VKELNEKKREMIPFSFLPPKMLRGIARHFFRQGLFISKSFPYLKTDLKQAEMDFGDQEYGAIALILAVVYFLVISIIVFFVAQKFSPENSIILGPTAGGIVGFMVLMQVIMYPKIAVKKKVREIERNLVFSLRTMLVQIKSGVTLFDSMNMIAEGNYGQLSKEFKKAVDEINTGSLEEDALQKLAENNPSPFFRRSIWQIVNGMKAGADVSNLMNELVSTMIKEETIQIRKYGNDLKMLSLMYMMIGVIVPALGLTLLIVLSSFPQIQFGEILFWGLLGFVTLGQFMFLGIIKSKRPNLIES